jgi:hypothetical protein
MTSHNTDTPRSRSIAERARHAAHQRDTDTGEPATWRNPRWAERAEACATALATLLQLPRDRIEVTGDTIRKRAYGQWPWPRLTATDPDGATYEFFAAYTNPDCLLTIHPCPACLGEVPMAWIKTLADLGDLLTGDLMTRQGWSPAPEFRGDPGHQPHCPHAHLD